MDAIEVRKAARELRAIWAAANEYLQAAAPWTTVKEDRPRAAMQVRLGLNLIRLHAVLSAPFVPDAAASMLAALRTEDAAWPEDPAAGPDGAAAGASLHRAAGALRQDRRRGPHGVGGALRRPARLRSGRVPRAGPC